VTAEEAAVVLADAGRAGERVGIRGAGTKLGWGCATPDPDLELGTRNMARLVAHNAADLTAEVEAGTPLAEAQAVFAEAGQMLALDPPLGVSDGATIGGVIATSDSGPLRHRFGSARDLLLGMTVVLSDGTVARSGGTVIKNVAGYDLAKLFGGSFGTLGLIARVALRLHPLPPSRATAVGATDDRDAARRAVSALTELPLELESLDVRRDATGIRVLARSAGAEPEPRARRAVQAMAMAGLDARLEPDDDLLWDRQRSEQRSTTRSVVRVSGVPSGLPRVLAAADRVGGTVVGRAGLGISWVSVAAESAGEVAGLVGDLRGDLAPAPCVLFDAPADVRRTLDPWGPLEPAVAALGRRLKERFDPAGILNAGIFAGGV
jgi:glycolate oxidase FAD binding subunit